MKFKHTDRPGLVSAKRWRGTRRVTGLDLDRPTRIPTPSVREPWPDEFDLYMTDLHLEADREAFRLSEV